MTQAISLRELHDITATEWDAVVGAYADTTVFHLSSWHACLADSLPGKVVRFAVESDGQVCGHWCGFLVSKFGARVFGAALPGTATDYMHPLFSSRPPVGLFLDAVNDWAKERRVATVDLGGEYYSDADLTAKGYQLQKGQTYRVDLSNGAAAVWKNLKPAMRNKVRKAEKSGVTVSEDRSPEFAGRFFEMLQAVFNRQGLTPTYGLKRVESVVRLLTESGNIVNFTAWHDDKPLASIIVLVDDRAFYFWGGASFEAAYPVGANDIIHWHAMQLAIERGLNVYDTCGGGDYKTKFGGTHVRIPAGYNCLNPMFGVVRVGVQKMLRVQRTVMGCTKRFGRVTR